MPRYRIALAALALLALGSFSSRPAAAQVPPGCEPPPAGTPLTIAGQSGVSSSAPFALEGGAYTVDWATMAPSDRVTYIHLDAADRLPGETEIQQSLRSEVILNASGGTSGSAGQTHLYNVKAGKYYLKVRAPAGWSVTLTPIAV